MQSQQFTTTDEKMKYVIEELAKAYPGDINKPESRVRNDNGCNFAQLSLIHAPLRGIFGDLGNPRR